MLNIVPTKRVSRKLMLPRCAYTIFFRGRHSTTMTEQNKPWNVCDHEDDQDAKSPVS